MTTLVETHYGKVQGAQEGAVRVWRGIPYAQPPIGKLRFRAPQPPASWPDVRSATTFGPVAPQLATGLEARFSGHRKALPTPAMAEDCLYLNVWAPSNSEQQYPVMVWIHGGSFVTGSGSTPLYDGARFAAEGQVVIVTINYRLGPLGFLHLGSLGPDFDNNLGLLDQLAALQWVQQNIAAFGGDPTRVTVFGESAGAMSIADLLGMPAARGLFQAAILQSGAVRLQKPERATQIARLVMAELGVTDAAGLRQVSVEELLRVSQLVMHKTPGGLPFQPVFDGQTMPKQPLEAVAAGDFAGVPMLIGTNRDEGNLFITPSNTPAQHQQFARFIEPIVGPERAMPIASTYPASLEGQAQLMTDTVFWLPALQLAEQQAPHAPVWMYRFDWSSTQSQLAPGAFHALELPFVWNQLFEPLAHMFTGPGAPQALADAMHHAWLAFAQQHDPNTPELPTWPSFEATERATMVFDAESHIENDPQSDKRHVWLNTVLS